jgi:hypothetical protein
MVLIFLAGLISGCGQVVVFGHTIGEKTASEVNTNSTAASQDATAPSGHAPKDKTLSIPLIRSVTLVLTPQVAGQVTNDSRFDRDALLTAISSELKSRKLLDETNSHASTAEVSIEEYAMRPTSNVILFGNIISAGTLNGSIQLRDELGRDFPLRHIEADSQVSIPASGQTINPLGRLYRQFAIVTANVLDSTPPQPIIGADQHPR